MTQPSDLNVNSPDFSGTNLENLALGLIWSIHMLIILLGSSTVAANPDLIELVSGPINLGLNRMTRGSFHLNLYIYLTKF